MERTKHKPTMETLAALCKRRGFIFQSSEIYGGINGFGDYGPLGCELKRNIRDAWWQDVVRNREDVVGLDASIIMHPKVWEASGHLDGFSDPMRTCRQCGKHFRADQIDELFLNSEWVQSIGKVVRPTKDGFVGFHSDDLWKWAHGPGRNVAPGLALVRNPDVTLSWLEEKVAKDGPNIGLQTWLSYLATEQFAQTGLVVPCPLCGGELTDIRHFNLMFQTQIGAMGSHSSVAYLRPETAQGIFVQFVNILAIARQKVPFGIAQIGKAFRNEINPRNYTFRSREFEQMELEFFVKPGTDAQWHEYWVAERMKWYESVGLPAASLTKHVYGKDELAHYASACVDILYDFPFGAQELEGIAARGDYDLSRHQQFSGKSMEYFDAETNERYVPHVVEPSAGVDRIALAILCEAYREEWVPGSDKGGPPVEAEPGQKPPEGYEPRTILRFHPRVAPVKVGVFPLLKNKPELVSKAREVFDLLRRRWACFYDQGGAIGRRYRRQDEIGTPFCVTVDFKTLEDGTVTVRDRDSMLQERVEIGKLADRLASSLG